MDDDEYVRPTSSYQMGTLTIYRSPRNPKQTKPAYGFKFVQTDARKRRKRKADGK